MLAWIVATTIMTTAVAEGGRTTQASTPTWQGAAPGRSMKPPIVTATDPPTDEGFASSRSVSPLPRAGRRSVTALLL
jgi:hypothetical protein